MNFIKDQCFMNLSDLYSFKPARLYVIEVQAQLCKLSEGLWYQFYVFDFLWLWFKFPGSVGLCSDLPVEFY